MKVKKVIVTISLGITEVLSSDKNVAEMYKRVDGYMYKAKIDGRNKIVSHMDENPYGER